MLKYNQSSENLMETRNKLNETKDKLDKARDDINKKTKHIDELEGIEKEFNYQTTKTIKLKNELIKKNESSST